MVPGIFNLLVSVLGDYSPRHMALEPDIATFFVICTLVSLTLHMLSRRFVLACIVSIVAIHIVEYIAFAISEGAGPHVMWSFPSILPTVFFASPITLLVGGVVALWKRSRVSFGQRPDILQIQDCTSRQASDDSATPAVTSCCQCHENLTVFLLTQAEPLEKLSCPRCGAKLAQVHSQAES